VPELTALVVDDSPAMRRQICQVLAELPGLITHEAADGAEAWRLLAAGRFDILLTDLNMPRLDGLKLVALVRRGGPGQAMPVVVITTESAGADGRRALELGADAWLEKPVDGRRLIEVVQALLQRG